MNKKILAGKRSVLIKINNLILIILLCSLLLLLPKIFAFDNLISLDSDENNSLILLRLEYKDNSPYDINNDGVETPEGIIDFTVENTIFNLNINESNLCTRWNIYSIENETSVTVCYGAKACCNFIGLEPLTPNWGEVFYSYYGRYGATNNNKVSAQVVYVDYSLEPENLYSDIYYSSWSSLSAIFKKEIKLYTKITNFVNDRLSILRGAVMKITAVLSYVNDSPIEHESISLYLNNSLVDTKTTDVFGNAAFELNTTDLAPEDYILNISFPGKTIQSPQETIILMPSFNSTFIEILPSNETINDIEIKENLTQLPAEINKPVKWVKKIEIKNTENETRTLNISFKLPEEAKDITVERDRVKINESEKSGIIKGSFGASSISTGPCFELKEIKNKEKLFEIKDEINQTRIEYRIEYETEAPKKEEINFDDKNKIKQIMVYSNVSFHYYNVKAFTEIPEYLINPRLYHIINNTRTDVTDKEEYDVKFLDTDNNGLYDKVEWVVPQLSEQLFEIGLATINTKKSIYHPGEIAEIIMVVLDKDGYLVGNADVSLEIANPGNQKTYYSTSSGAVTETEKGIYEASYPSTGLEGNYSMVVEAIGDNVNNVMASYFTVKEYYEFDILRDTPVTTDPWKGPFSSSVKIISFTNDSVFDFSEVLPADFNVIEGSGSIVTEENNKKILTWQNLANNSIVSYSAQIPLATPELYEIGPSYINYNSEIFTEARPWYLAVDPVVTEYDPNSDVQTGFVSDCANHYECVDDGVYSPSTPSTSGDRITANSNNQDGYYEEWGFPSISQSNVNSIKAYVYLTTGSKNQFDIRLQQSGTTRASTPVSVSSSLDWYTATWSSIPSDADLSSMTIEIYHTRSAAGKPSDAYIYAAYLEVNFKEPPPEWSNNKTDIVAVYSPNTQSKFNITWTSMISISQSLFESNYSQNPENYSMSSLGSGVYQYSKILPAGTHYWKSHANNSESVWNSTDTWLFTIARATPIINLTLNGSAGNITMYEDNSVWLNGTTITGDNIKLLLYKNGSLINNDTSPSNYTLFDNAGYYNITLIYPESQNYTSDRIEYFVNVSDATAPNVSLVAPTNNSYTRNINLSFYYNVSDYSEIANCTINISTSQEKYVNQSPIDKSGTNNFTINNVEQTAVYWFVECTDLSLGRLTGQSETRVLKVDATSPTLGYITPPTPENNSFKNTSEVVINVSHTEDNPANPDTIILYVNGTINKKQGYSAGSDKFTNFSLNLEDGEYRFSVFINDSAGNNNSLSNLTVTVDTIPPRIDYDPTNPIQNNNQSEDNFIVNVTHYENNPDTIILYVNGNLNKSQSYSGSFTNFSLENIGDGAYSYYVWLNDSAVNHNKTPTRTITVDSTPPKIFLESPKNDTWSKTKNNALKYNTTDFLLRVDNCSLIIDGKSNQTNHSITEGVSQTFNVYLGDSMGYYWRIDCADDLNNINSSETRLIKIDTTYPQVSNESINGSNFDVNKYACLNLTVTDTFSDVKSITVAVDYPSGLKNVTLSNASGGCGNAGGSTWSYSLKNNEEGEYNWTKTYAEDFAGNINTTSPKTNLNWSAESHIFINVTMDEPSSDIKVNVSTSQKNNSFSMVCNATCWLDSTEGCNDIHLFAEYYNNGWEEINTETTKLINNLDNSSCGNLSIGEKCSGIFNVTTGKYSGGEIFDIRCKGVSSNAPNDYSDAVNLIINDFPVAAFTYPQNGSYLHETEILNASSSTDDQGIANYLFELDNNTNFDSPTELCNGASPECSFNTITQNNQCNENSFDCFIRLNVTDSDGLENSTYISVQIDNTNPYVNLDWPFNNNWENSNSVEFKYTPYDLNIESCTLYHNSSGWQENETNSNEQNGVQNSFSINLYEGSYLWNVWCNDSAGNSAFNSTNYTVNVDSVYPLIEFAGNTENNDTYFNRNWIYAEVSVTEDNFANITFELYDSSLALVNSTDYATETYSINFTNLADTNEAYYYNVSVRDSAGNENFTETRKITLDDTYPKIDFSADVENNDTYFNRDWVYVNVTITEDNVDKTKFYLYNSTLHLVNNTNITDGSTYVNFTSLTDTNEVYYYNATVVDEVGFEDSTETRKITLDDTSPIISLDDPSNGKFMKINNVMFNYTPSDINLDNCTLYGNFSGTWQSNQTHSSPSSGLKNSFNAITLNDGHYIWNVECYDKAGNSAFNSTNFTLNIDVSPPTEFNLVSPVNDTYSKSRAPLLDWTEPTEPNFDNYTIIFDDSQTFDSINHIYEVTNSVSNTSYQIKSEEQLQDNTKFYWKVLAYDNLSNNRNSTQVFIYTTDNQKPSIKLEYPENNTKVTSSFLVDFYYNVSDNFNVKNCSLIVDGNTENTESTISMSVSQEISAVLTNGDHNWSINCTDYAGNVNSSEMRNISIDVAVPKLRFYETATGAISGTGAQSINLSDSVEANADYTTLTSSSNGMYQFVIATISDNANFGPNGILIPASTSVFFDGIFSSQRSNWGYAYWDLEYYDGSNYVDICTDQSTGYISTTKGQVTGSCTSPSSPIQLNYGGLIRLKVFVNVVGDSQPTTFTHYWDSGENSGFDLYAYKLGNAVVNLSSPITAYTVNESDVFNATCNVSCSQGWCYNTKVYIQLNTSNQGWANINSTSGNLIYTEGTNPILLGQINSTNLVNFTLLGNQISKDTNIRCIATSDYSNADGIKTANIIVNDYIYPTVELNSPQNNSWDNDGNAIFYYIPNDNYNVSNCSLIINNTINQTNHTIAKGIQNNFTLNNLNDASYSWSVNCTDSFDNTNSSDTWVVNIDTVYPKIEFGNNNEKNDTLFSRDWIFVNVSIIEDNKNETRFYLYNSSLDLVNNTNYTNGNTYINFTNLNFDMVYYYNVTIIDKAGNINSTQTRKITLDKVPPSIVWNYPVDDYNTSNDFINFNWTSTDNVPTNNITCNLTIDGAVNKSNISSSNGLPTNYTITGFFDGTHTWNLTCWDSLNNTNTSETRQFTVVDGPENLTAGLASDNVSIIITWSSKAYADSYNIYAKEDYTDEFALVDSEITDTDWTDSNAGSYTTRFYKVTTVRGTANKTTIKVVGKYEAELINNTESISDWNLVSIPLNITNWELDNGTNNGFDFHSNPEGCIISLWRYSDADGWERTNYNGSAWNPAQGDESFTSIESGRGYWFEVNNTCDIIFVGEVPIENKSISLDLGWNLAGWFSPNSSELPVGGSSAYPITVSPSDSVDAIDRYNPITDEFEVTIYLGSNIWWPSWLNMGFTSIEPTKGYYFDANQPAIWEHKPNT